MNLLVISAGVFHPPLLGRQVLRQFLLRLPDNGQFSSWSVQFASSMEALPGMDLSRIDALALYFHHKQISDAALQAFDQFVFSGGGVLAIHSATASFKQREHYFEILGGRFTGHGPVGHFSVQPVAGSPLVQGVSPFTIRDELYLHELQPGVQAHFTAQHEGQAAPLVWTHAYGRGRVFYACPGHTTSAMRSASYQKVLLHGLEWLAANGFSESEGGAGWKN